MKLNEQQKYMSRIIDVDFLNKHCHEIYKIWEPFPIWLCELISSDILRRYGETKERIRLVDGQLWPFFHITTSYERRIIGKKLIELRYSMTKEELEAYEKGLIRYGNDEYLALFKFIETYPEYEGLIKPEFRSKKLELLSENFENI